MPNYFYRALRRNEDAKSMRQPDHDRLASLCHQDLRREVLLAIATGNKTPSPFLHVTTDLNVARRIMQERASLYNGMVVRFPTSAISAQHTICICSDKARKQFLNQNDGDSEEVISHLYMARKFTQKDKEVLLLKRPSQELIEVVDVYTGLPVSEDKEPDFTGLRVLQDSATRRQ